MAEIERDLLRQLRENQDAAIRALRADDMVALKVLARDEARLMDALRAIWAQRGNSSADVS